MKKIRIKVHRKDAKNAKKTIGKGFEVPCDLCAFAVRIPVFYFLIFALSCSGPLYFADLSTRETEAIWEQYGGYEGRTGYDPTGMDPPLTLIGRMKAGSTIMAAPLVRGDVIYAADVDGKVHAWDRKTGESLGRWRSKGTVLGTPAFWNGLLVLPKCGKRGELVALDMTIGKVRWRLGEGSASCPLVAGNRLFAVTESGAVVSLNPADGEVLWRFEMAAPTRSSIAREDTVLYIGSNDGVAALRESRGELLWEQETTGSVWATPTAAEDGVYVGSTDGSVYRLDRASGEVIWTSKVDGGIYGGCAVDSTRVYFGATDRALYALDRSTGRQMWRLETQGVIRAAPVTTGRTVYVGSTDRFFYAVAVDSGALLWKHRTDNACVSPAALVQDGVYLGSTDGFVYAFGREE